MSVYSRLMSYNQCRALCFSYKRYNLSVRHYGNGTKVVELDEGYDTNSSRSNGGQNFTDYANSARSNGGQNFENYANQIPSVTNWCSFLVLSITSIGIIAGFGFFVLGSLDVAKKDTRDGLKEVKKDTRDGLKEVKKDTLEGLKEIMRLFEIHAADEKKRYEQVMEVYRSRQAK